MFGGLAKQFKRALSDPLTRAKAAVLGCGISAEPDSPNKAAMDAFMAEAKGRLQAGDFAGFEASYQRYFITKRTLPNGQRAYAKLEEIVNGQIDTSETPPLVAERMLPRFEEAWEASGRSPFMSAVYGTLLFNTGYCFRGSDAAGAVSQSGWRKLGEYSEAAHQVFASSAGQAQSSPYWHRARLFTSISDGSTGVEMSRLFERAVAFDPLDVNVHTARSYQLLPRWHGSYEEHEAFAMQAVARTQAALGHTMYARIYWNLADVEDVGEMHAKWSLLKRGFEDWYGASQLQWVLNAYASAAHHFEDHEAVLDVIKHKMTHFHPDAWLSPRQAADVFEWAA